jgi:MFS transporter, ACS family, glucarate transporter
MVEMRNPQVPWKIVIMLCATATASYICRVNISTAGPLLMKEFHLSQIAMGRLLSAFLLGYALFQAPAGFLADYFGARKVLRIVPWLWVAITILLTLVNWGPFQTSTVIALTSFMTIRLLLGITESPTYPASAKGVSRWIIPHFQGRANGIIIASIGIGSALAPPLVSSIMIHWGWRMSLIASALPALIVAIIWLRIREPVPAINYGKSVPDNSEISHRDTNSKFKLSGFILLTISYTLQGYVGYIFVTWFYIYLVQERHFGLISGAWMSSLPWVLSIISIPLGGYVSDRLAGGSIGPIWGRRLVPIAGMAFSGILISVGAHTGSAVMAAISLAFATAFILCVESPFWTMMLRISGKNSGTAGGIMNFGSNIGGFISPWLTPLIAFYIGWENALHVAGILAIIAAALWLAIKPDTEA